MSVFYDKDGIVIHCGDCRGVLPALPEESVNCCVTSPPYWGLRDYGIGSDAFGLETSIDLYVEHAVEIFRAVRRVLRDDGTLWLNLGDSYASGGRSCWQSGASDNKGHGVLDNAGFRPDTPEGLKPKDLCGIPWRVAFALQADGWYLRQDIVWAKPNPMPESVTDRCTKAHEYIFLLSKSERYYFNQEAILEPCSHADESKYDNGLNGHGGGVSHAGQWSSTRKFRSSGNKEGSDRNKRSVWTVATQAFPGAHFATFPERLITPCILAGCPTGGLVMDPFTGSGMTAFVARKLGCRFVGAELNEEYCKLAASRLRQRTLAMSEAIDPC